MGCQVGSFHHPAGCVEIVLTHIAQKFYVSCTHKDCLVFNWKNMSLNILRVVTKQGQDLLQSLRKRKTRNTLTKLWYTRVIIIFIKTWNIAIWYVHQRISWIFLSLSFQKRLTQKFWSILFARSGPKCS